MLGTGLDPNLWETLEETKIFQDMAARYFLEDYNGQLGFSNMGNLLRAAKWAGLERDKLGLDLCCGNGRPGLFIIRRNRCRLVGFDISSSALQVGQYRAGRYAVKEKSSFVQGDIKNPLPFAAQSFDGVVALEGFPPGQDLKFVFGEIQRVLKPAGGLAFYSLLKEFKGNLPNQEGKGFTATLEEQVKLLEAAGFTGIKSFDVTGELRALVPRMKKTFEERGVLERLQDNLGKSIAGNLYSEITSLNTDLTGDQIQRWFLTGKSPTRR